MSIPERLWLFAAGPLGLDASPLPHTSPTGFGAKVTNLVFGLAAATCLLVIVLAGMRYVLSKDNPQETARAKNQIIYALVGLVMVLISSAIVTFVLDNLG